jgi:serine protease AprX
MSSDINLPLKVVPPLERDFYKPDAGGGPKKVFQPVNREFRERLASEVMQVRKHFRQSFNDHPTLPAVARLKVREDAIAKSHRPTALFTPKTCPIIGAEGLGHILLSVTPNGLDKLASRIEKDKTKQGIANLSTLRAIEAFTPSVEAAAGEHVKVKLFRHHTKQFDSVIDETFKGVLKELKVRNAEAINYGGGLKVYRLPGQRPEIVEVVRRYVGTQSIGPFPGLSTCSNQRYPDQSGEGPGFSWTGHLD